METLLAIILIVFGVLQIILFFKIWGMTNDVREIKNKYLSETDKTIEKETYTKPNINNNSETQKDNTPVNMSSTSIYSGVLLILIVVLAIILAVYYK